MSAYPAPTRVAHRSFCEVEGWDLVRNAKGRAVTHHLTYELNLDDGRILRTRVSHPVDKTTYGRGVGKHILREQLDVSEKNFWACVQYGEVPERAPVAEQPSGIPTELFHLLVTRVGLPQTRVAAMSKDEAIAAATEYWTRPDA